MLGSPCPRWEAIDMKEELRTLVQSLLSIEILKNDTKPKDTTVKKKGSGLKRCLVVAETVHVGR